MVMPVTDSFRTWLKHPIAQVLGHKAPAPPLLIWYEIPSVPARVGLDVATGAGFEVWAEEVPSWSSASGSSRRPGPRVIWLPVAREQATYIKVLELQATEVRQWTLPKRR